MGVYVCVCVCVCVYVCVCVSYSLPTGSSFSWVAPGLWSPLSSEY